MAGGTERPKRLIHLSEAQKRARDVARACERYTVVVWQPYQGCYTIHFEEDYEYYDDRQVVYATRGG